MNSDVQLCRITEPIKKNHTHTHTHTLSLSLQLLHNEKIKKKTSTTENNTVQKSGNKNYAILFPHYATYRKQEDDAGCRKSPTRATVPESRVMTSVVGAGRRAGPAHP
jgi:hypothetical protein